MMHAAMKGEEVLVETMARCVLPREHASNSASTADDASW